jgi:polysaccharide deacetylase family protein (PEP-CTERM system associated)
MPSWMTRQIVRPSNQLPPAWFNSVPRTFPGTAVPPGSAPQHRYSVEAAESPGIVVLSFDIEEHHRIEAAVGTECCSELRLHYARRMEAATMTILDRLSATGVKATFFIVGEIARNHPGLIRRIAAEGHEIGSHSWDHRRVHSFTVASFRDDLRRSIAVLEDISGTPVVGYRAPTFSLMRSTAWAVDVLAEVGLRYDSSIFPVRHDRYGVPDAPRIPFLAAGRRAEILEIPPATWRVLGQNLPVAGGGYFRLFPTQFLHAGVSQLRKLGGVSMLYFHPWEFDPDQPRLPLSRLSSWRTYVGIRHNLCRLERLIHRYRGSCCRAMDLLPDLEALAKSGRLPTFALAETDPNRYDPAV